MRWSAALGRNVNLNSHISTYHVSRKCVSSSNVRLYSTSFSPSGEQGQNSQEFGSHFQRTEGRKPLPLPPVLNPSLVAAQKRYCQPKAEPSGQDRTEFQEKLYRNPYGE